MDDIVGGMDKWKVSKIIDTSGGPTLRGNNLSWSGSCDFAFVQPNAVKLFSGVKKCIINGNEREGKYFGVFC